MVLLFSLAAAYVPVRASDNESTYVPVEAAGTTTVRVTVLPTVIARPEAVSDANGINTYAMRITGNTPCRTVLTSETERGGSSPQVLRFLTYL